jgi:hypothetical protein
MSLHAFLAALARRVNAFNNGLANAITTGVSTMWCAYVFALIALTSLKPTLALHSTTALVAWVTQTFIQLVLLSIIMVGQKLQAQKSNEIHSDVIDLHARHDTLEANHREILGFLRGKRGQLGNEGTASDSDQPSGQDRADADPR